MPRSERGIRMTRILLGLVASLAVTAQAHFLFVVPGPGGRTARVFLSEELKPETGIEPKLLAGAKLMARGAGGAGRGGNLDLVESIEARP